MSKKAPYDRKNKQDKSVYRALVLIMQFGINMLVPIGIMSWLGILLDRRFDTSFFMVLFFFIGAIAGFQNIWRMAKSVYEEKPREDKAEEQRTQERKFGSKLPNTDWCNDTGHGPCHAGKRKHE